MINSASQGRRSLPLVLFALLCLLLAVGAETSSAKPKKGKPRLQITGVAPAESSVQAGSNLRVEGTIRNKGKKAYGGPDDRGAIEIELRGGGIDPTPVGTAAIPRVKRKQTRTFSTTVAIPVSLNPDGDGPVGPFDVVACVRAQGDEGNLSCRAAAASLTVTPANPPNYTPGARSLGDRLFPQIGNGGYDALGYAIDLDYDPATNSFASGTSTTMTAEATQDLSELSMDFQRDLTVSAVTVNGTAAAFQQVDATPEFAPDVPAADQPAKLVVTPARGIRTGAEFSVKVDYAGTPDEITDADESIEGWIRACQVFATETGCDGSFTVNEPIGAQSWYPSNNYPSDKATIDTAITVPTGFETIGTGELTGAPTGNGDGTTTWSWSEDDPTSTYLASATVGQFDYSDDTTLTETSTGRAIPIYLAIDSAFIQATKDTFATRVGPDPVDHELLQRQARALPVRLDRGRGRRRQRRLLRAREPDEAALRAQRHDEHAAGRGNAGPRDRPPVDGRQRRPRRRGTRSGSTRAGRRSPRRSTPRTPTTPRCSSSSTTSTRPTTPSGTRRRRTCPVPPTCSRASRSTTARRAMLEGFREIVGDDAFYGFARTLTSGYAYDNDLDRRVHRRGEGGQRARRSGARPARPVLPAVAAGDDQADADARRLLRRAA